MLVCSAVYFLSYCRYKDAVFTEMKSCVLHLEEEGTDITLLVTSTKLFIWLTPQIWNSEPSAIWEAANVGQTCHDI